MLFHHFLAIPGGYGIQIIQFMMLTVVVMENHQEELHDLQVGIMFIYSETITGNITRNMFLMEYSNKWMFTFHVLFFEQ